MARPITFDPEAALERAMDLFWTRGYHRVSVEDIVQVTGLNRHSLYARYGSKFGLLQAAIDHYRDQVLDRIQDIVSEEGTARERLARMLAIRQDSQHDEIWHQMVERGCFALRVSAELRDTHPELGESLDAFTARLESLVTDTVREGQERGEIRADRTSEHLASVLVVGFLLPLVYSPPNPPIDAFIGMLD